MTLDYASRSLPFYGDLLRQCEITPRRCARANSLNRSFSLVYLESTRENVLPGAERYVAGIGRTIESRREFKDSEIGRSIVRVSGITVRQIALCILSRLIT